MRGIRFWMLAVSLSATLPMLALLVAVTLWLQYQQGLQREASLQRQALRAADAVGSLLALQEARISTVAAGVAAREQRLAVLHQVLQAVAAADAGISSISFIDARGQRILDSRVPFGQPLPPSGTAQLDQRVLSTGESEVSSLTNGTISGKQVVGVAVPVRSHDERTVGALRLVLQPAMFDRHLMRLPTPPGWVVAILDQNAVIVARNQSPEQFRGQRATDTIVAQLKRPPGEVHRGETRDGRKVLAVVSPVATTGWYVAVGAPEADVDRAERETLATVVLAGLAVTILSVASTLWIGGRVTRQVQQAAHGQLREGSGIRELQHLGRRMEDAEAALEEARHDVVTGLPGRAMFMERAQAQYAADHAGSAFGLLYLDLDGFKALNDAHGHDAGDAALAHVGRVLQGELRPDDLAARLGGDEFVVLLLAPDVALEAACEQVASRIQAGIAAHGHGLGCSIGLVRLRPSESVLEAMTRADQAMLTAKRSGKGRIVQA